MHRIHTIALVATLSVATLVAAGCGSDDGERGSAKAGGRAPAASTSVDEGDGAVTADLEVVVAKVGSKGGGGVSVPTGLSCTRSIPATCRGTIRCPAAEDASKGDRGACDWLAGEGSIDALRATAPEHEACTAIYGGPEVATVRGTIDGEELDNEFSRQNGCAIARFEAVAPLWNGGEEPEAPDADAGAKAPPVDPIEPGVVSDPPSAFER